MAFVASQTVAAPPVSCTVKPLFTVDAAVPLPLSPVPDDGHTLSVVTHDQLPRTIQQVDNRGVCNDLIAAHFPNGFPPRGAPVLVLDDFKASAAPARFDSVGDSVIVAPSGVGLPTSVSVVISALPGTTLDDMCAVPPLGAGQHSRRRHRR